MLPAAPVAGSHNVSDARLRRLYIYWAEKKGGRAAPARCEINPVEIRDLLGFLNIFEVQDDPRDYRVRLNGTEITQTLGQEVTGKLCSTVMSGEDAVRCKAAFDFCVDQCVPTIVGTSLAFCGKPYLAQTVIVLPLSSDGERVDMMITAHSFHAIDYGEKRGQPAPRLAAKK